MGGTTPAGIPGTPGQTNINAMPYRGVPPNWNQQQFAMGSESPADTSLGPQQGGLRSPADIRQQPTPLPSPWMGQGTTNAPQQRYPQGYDQFGNSPESTAAWKEANLAYRAASQAREPGSENWHEWSAQNYPDLPELKNATIFTSGAKPLPGMRANVPPGPKNEDIRTGPGSKYPSSVPPFMSGGFPDFNQQALALAGAPAAGGPTIQANPASMGGGPIGFQPNIPGTTLPFYQNPMGEQLTTGAEMIGERLGGGGRRGPRQGGNTGFSHYGQPAGGMYSGGMYSGMDQTGFNPGIGIRSGGGAYRR